MVHSVYVGCSEGQVTWRYPHGGLRVAFILPTHYDDDDPTYDYDVCCVVSVAYSDVKLSLDTGDTLRVVAVMKTSSSSSSESMEFCFETSRDRAVSLYAESLTSHPLSRVVGRTVVDYDVRSRHNVTSSRDMRGEFPVCLRP